MKYIIKDGRQLAYFIQRKKIKNIYFRTKDDYIYITANKKVSEKNIKILVEQKFDLLYQKLQRKTVLLNNEIRLWGKPYTLEVLKGEFNYQITETHVICKSKEFDIDLIRKQIYLVEIKKMMSTLRQRIISTLNQVHIEELPYKYKYLKSKYGSYHRKHQEITLNTYLTTLDPIYLEYVIYHEYAHHKVFNHSKAFYEVLDNMMINHKVIQKRLKKMEII